MKRFWFLLVLVLVAWPVGTAVAAGRHDRVVRAPDVVVGDLNVFGDDVVIEAGATVQGNVNVWDGDAAINGAVEGDLFVLGGDVRFGRDATLSGKCVIIGGDLKLEGGRSDVHCARAGEPGLNVPGMADMGRAMRGGRGAGAAGGGPFSLLVTLGTALSAALIAGLTAVVAPRRLERIEDAVAAKPAASGAVGVLTLFAGIALTAVLSLLSAVLTLICIGLLGFPIVLALVALLALGLVVGWSAVGSLLGEQITHWLRLRKLSQPVVAALGAGALTLAVGLVELLPLGGFAAGMARLILGSVGLGAVALTKFGARPYPPTPQPTADAEKVQAAIDNMPF